MEDYKDTHIAYKTAVLAKQKGFFCICPHRFINEDTILGGWLHTSEYEPTEKDIEEYVKDPCKLPLASTQQILRDWIEKKFKFSVLVDFETKEKEVLYFAKILDTKKGSVKNLPGRFKKYKDAMEDGLFTALSEH